MSDIRNRVFAYVIERLLDLLVVIAAAGLTWVVVKAIVNWGQP